MDVKQLRIGNIVYDGGNYPENVTEITLADFYNMHEDDNCPFEGIHLKEEWLVKFGFIFECESLNGKWFIKDDFEIHIDCNGNCFLVFDNMNNLLIKSVHLLQNLYFDLTGQELIIQN